MAQADDGVHDGQHEVERNARPQSRQHAHDAKKAEEQRSRKVPRLKRKRKQLPMHARAGGGLATSLSSWNTGGSRRINENRNGCVGQPRKHNHTNQSTGEKNTPAH